MDKRRVLIDPREVVIDVLLGGGVAPEVDGSGGSHTHQVGAQAAVHPTDALVTPNMPEISQLHFCRFFNNLKA